MERLTIACGGPSGCGRCQAVWVMVGQQLGDLLAGVMVRNWPVDEPVDLLLLHGGLAQWTVGDWCQVSQYVGLAVALGRCCAESLPRDLHLPVIAGCPPSPGEVLQAIEQLLAELLGQVEEGLELNGGVATDGQKPEERR